MHQEMLSILSKISFVNLSKSEETALCCLILVPIQNVQTMTK